MSLIDLMRMPQAYKQAGRTTSMLAAAVRELRSCPDAKIAICGQSEQQLRHMADMVRDLGGNPTEIFWCTPDSDRIRGISNDYRVYIDHYVYEVYSVTMDRKYHDQVRITEAWKQRAEHAKADAEVEKKRADTLNGRTIMEVLAEADKAKTYKSLFWSLVDSCKISKSMAEALIDEAVIKNERSV